MASEESKSSDSTSLVPAWKRPLSVSDSDLPQSLVAPKTKKRTKKSGASSKGSTTSSGKKKKKSGSTKSSSSQSSSSSSSSSSSDGTDGLSGKKKGKSTGTKKKSGKKKKTGGKKKDSLGSMDISPVSPMIRSQTEVAQRVVYDDTLPPMPELLPAFLDCDSVSKSGGSSSSSARVAGGERDFYQRKKDVKLLNLQRECDETEQEFTEKWSQSYGKSLEGIELDWGGMELRVCIDMLLTMDEEWENRMLIVQTLVHQLCQDEESVSDEIYCLKMCKFMTALGRQFMDARSLVIEDMHRHLARLARLSSERFVFFAPYFYSRIIVIFGIRIEVMRESVVNLGEAMINACLLSDLNEENPNQHALLRAVVEGLDYKSADGRMQSARFLGLYLSKMRPFLREFSSTSVAASALDLSEDAKASDADDEGEDATMDEDGGDMSELFDLIEYLDDAVRKAVNGSSTEIRNQGYICLKRWETLAPKHAQLIVERMSKAVLRKYKKIKNQRRTSLY